MKKFKCPRCGGIISKKKYNLCQKCYLSQNKGKNHPSFGMKFSKEVNMKKGLKGKENPMYGKENKWGNHTSETKQKISDKLLNEKNGMWKGDSVGYDSLHSWVKRRIPKPKLCEMCNKNKPYDLSNISGKYKRDVNDFKWLCRSCHIKLDRKKCPRCGKFYSGFPALSRRNDVYICSRCGVEEALFDFQCHNERKWLK